MKRWIRHPLAAVGLSAAVGLLAAAALAVAVVALVADGDKDGDKNGDRRAPDAPAAPAVQIDTEAPEKPAAAPLEPEPRPAAQLESLENDAPETAAGVRESGEPGDGDAPWEAQLEEWRPGEDGGFEDATEIWAWMAWLEGEAVAGSLEADALWTWLTLLLAGGMEAWGDMEAWSDCDCEAAGWSSSSEDDDPVAWGPGEEPWPDEEPGEDFGDEERVVIDAEIADVTIVVAESWPPQYFVHVTSVQPDACHQFAGYSEEREGDAITITVLNSVPADLATYACAMMISMTKTSIPLGSDFTSGRTYTVTVNGEAHLLEAQ